MWTNTYSAWTKYRNDNGVTVHHLHVSVLRIYRNARFIWYTGNKKKLFKINFETHASSKCKKIYKLDWFTLIFSDVTSSCLNFADTFWNWRVRIFNVIYWNIGPYLEYVVIKFILRICCFCNSILIFNHTFSMMFKSGLWACHSMVLISFSSMNVFVTRAHSDNNNCHLGSAWQWLATNNNCPRFQHILLHLLFHQL